MKRLLPFVAAMALAACSPRLLALRTVSPILQRGAEAFYEEPDPQLAKESMASQLKLVEVFLKSDPSNAGLLETAAQGFGGYAFLFLEDSQPERARQFYFRGRAWGLKRLNRNLSLRGMDSMPLQELEAALHKANKSDVPGLFWTAYCWAGWINLSKDSPDAVAGLPKAAAMMRRVQELSPGYYFGGPDLFLGSYYATLPRMLGGDPAKSKEHFEAAEKASNGRFIMAKTLQAQYYAVAAQDQALFQQLNKQVLASTDVYAQARLANEVAKLKSKRLLERMHELF